MTTLRVLLLEDDPWTCSVVATALRSHGVEVHASATAPAAMQVAAVHEVDIALLDLDLGDGPNGVDVALALHRRHPHIAIVILTSYEDPRLFISTLPALPPSVNVARKSSITDVQALLGLLRESLAGGPSSRSRVADLSDGQVEVLRLLASGATNAEIARQRFVSEKAVEHSIARLARHFDIAQDSAQNTRVLLTRVYLRMIGHPNAT